MAQLLKASADSAKDLGSNPSTHVVVKKLSVTPALEYLTPSFALWGNCTQMMHVNMQTKHSMHKKYLKRNNRLLHGDIGWVYL